MCSLLNNLQLWDNDLVIRISSHPAVVKVIALGTLFALELKAEGSDTGYDEIFCLSMILQKGRL